MFYKRVYATIYDECLVLFFQLALTEQKVVYKWLA